MITQQEKNDSHLAESGGGHSILQRRRYVPRLVPVLLCHAMTVIILTACEQEKMVKFTEQRIIHSGFYPLQATHHMFPEPGGAGGGIAYVDGSWLIVSADGAFYLFDRSAAGDDFKIRKLPYRAPLNTGPFLDSVAQDENRKALSAQFRTTDVVLNRSGGVLQLWLAHHWWNEEASCLALRASTAITDEKAFLNATLPGLDWSTVYEAMPCIEVKEGESISHFSGGKMVLAGNPPDTLYLTLGDQGYNGMDLPDLPQDPDASWGKVMKIDLKSGGATTFTTGHRNAQGLFLDDRGRLWLTEQGPRGGDELNLLKRGKNYGWPLVSYGTAYDTYEPWPLSKDPGHHGGFELPIYAWVPSIGVTDIMQLQGDRFPLWKGDLFVGSLRANALFRIHIRQGRAIVVEPILVTKRIRDMAEGPDGEIVLWTDNFRLIFIEPVPDPEWPEAESAMPH